MEATELKEVLDEIMDLLSCAMKNNPKCHECYVCRNEIKENENNATCETCSKHYHVSCMAFNCNDELNDLRLIWICSCGNANIAHRLFDEFCIPSHLNRYAPLEEEIDDSTDTDCNLPASYNKTNQRHARSKRRYVKKGNKSNVLPDKVTAEKVKTRNCRRDLSHDSEVKQSRSEVERVDSSEFDEDKWVKVKMGEGQI